MVFTGGAQRGQASVELVALLPILAVLCAVGWQLVVAGQTVWLAGTAARGAARAHALGRDAAVAGRGALPVGMRDGLRVRTGEAGRVSVRLRIPAVIPGGGRLGSVSRQAQFAPQEGG